MNKLRLSVDDLRVETFATDAVRAGRGTVDAHMITYASGCNTCQCSSRPAACFCTENLSCRCN